MESTRVRLHNWPHNPSEPGGWVMPEGDPLSRWVVTHVHARYVAPRIGFDEKGESGRRLPPRPELHAYVVDLSGEEWGLPDYERVVLHQKPPTRAWFIKPAEDDYLERIEKYRV